VPFPLTVFPEAFLIDLTLPIFLPQSQFDGVPLQLQNFLQIQLRGVRSMCFIGQRHDPVDSHFDEV